MNAGSLALLQSRLPDATCIQVNEKDRVLPAEDGSIGTVLRRGVFAVMPALWFLEEAVRVLRPGGLLIGKFHDKYWVRGVVKHALHRAGVSRGLDYYNTCYNAWKVWARARRIVFLQEEGICWMPFSISSDSHLVGPFVALERRLGLGRLPDLSPRVAS